MLGMVNQVVVCQNKCCGTSPSPINCCPDYYLNIQSVNITDRFLSTKIIIPPKVYDFTVTPRDPKCLLYPHSHSHFLSLATPLAPFHFYLARFK
jgi:hypothetical protein